MQYSRSTNAIPSSNSEGTSPIPGFANSFSKEKFANRTTDKLNQDLLQEAFKRALSGSKVGRMDGTQMMESTMFNRKQDTDAVSSSSVKTDFSNNYVQKRNKSKNDPSTLKRPAFMSKYSNQPKQVYLYERTDVDSSHDQYLEHTEPHDQLFIQLQDPETKLEAANCGAKRAGNTLEGQGVEDSISQETKSQITDFSSNVLQMKSHAFLQQSSQGINHEAEEARDAKMAQQAMIKRRTQMTQEQEGAASQMSEINFYQDLQENSQFQNANGPEESGNDLVVLDVDNTGMTREQVLANKRTSTAKSHDPCHPGGAHSSGALTRKRCTETDREQYIQQMTGVAQPSAQDQEDLYRVDYQNDLLNIVAQKPDERMSLGDPSDYDETSPVDNEQIQAEQPTNEYYDHQLEYSRDNQYAGAIRGLPAKAVPATEPASTREPPIAIHQSEAGESGRSPLDPRQRTSVAGRLRYQNSAADHSRSKKLAQGFITGATTSQNRAANGRSSRQNTGIQQPSDRRDPISSQQLQKTPTGHQKVWNSSQNRSSYKVQREKSQVSGTAAGTAAARLQKATTATRLMKSPAAGVQARSPGLAKSQSGRGEQQAQAPGLKTTTSGKTLQPQPWSQKAVTAEEIRSDMVAAFGKVRLDIYGDILRIKKPQSSAFTAAQMLCKVVNSFRGGSQKTNNDALFQDWTAIQDFVHRKPNVIKFHQEITQLIQHMILSQDYLNQLRHGQLKNHLHKLMKIQDQYFGLSSHEQVLRQFQTNKNFQQISNLCFTISRYVLFEAGKSELLNLGQHECADAEETTAHGTSRTLVSNKRSSNSTHCGNSHRHAGTQQRSSCQRGLGEGYRGNLASDHTPQRDIRQSKQQQNELTGQSQFSASFSQDQSAPRNIPVKNSDAKSPLITQNTRNITKTPRNENNIFQRMCAKSPMTQKYDIKSLGSASRSFKDPKEQQRVLPQRLQTFGPRGSQADENPHNQSFSATSGCYQPSQPSGSSPQKHRVLQGSQGRHSIEERQRGSQHMYELLLQKQRLVTQDRYERLTTSSVSKRPASKRLQATPGGERAGASDPTSTLKETQNVNAFTVEPDTPTEHTLITTPMKSEVRTPLKAPVNPGSVKDSKHTLNQMETLQENGYNTVYTAYEDEVQFEGRSRGGNDQRQATRSGVRKVGDQGKQPRKSRKERSERKTTVTKVVQITQSQLAYDSGVSGEGKPINLTFADAVIDSKQRQETNLEQSLENQAQGATEILDQEKDAGHAVPLQEQHGDSDTSAGQLAEPQAMEQVSMVFLQEASVDGLVDGPRTGEGSEGNPDVDILEQMQMIAPAPLPQPAPPLELTQGAMSSSCFDNTSEAPIEEIDLTERHPREANPTQINYHEIGAGIISQVPIDIQTITQSIEEAPNLESSPEPEVKLSPDNKSTHSQAIACVQDNQESLEEELGYEIVEAAAENIYSHGILPESQGSEESQEEQEYEEAEDELEQESSPGKESSEFDPFAEAQRIAAIIKAGCNANLPANVPQEQSQNEEEVSDHQTSLSNEDRPRVDGCELEEASSEGRATIQHSPAQVDNLQTVEAADEEVDEEPLLHFRALTKIPEDVRLSVQSLGNTTVLASKDNLIQYKQGDHLMESLYMTSFSQDYTLDGERGDQREMTIGVKRKSTQNGTIGFEQSMFEEHLEQSEDMEVSRDGQRNVKQASIYEEYKLSQQHCERSEDERTDLNVHGFSRCNPVDDLSSFEKMTPRTMQNPSVDQVVSMDDMGIVFGELKMGTIEKAQPEAVEEEDVEESETQSPQKTERDMQQTSTFHEQSQCQTIDDNDEDDMKKEQVEKKIIKLNVADVCESHSDSRSSGNSELCMQEILSPFRQQNSYSSPQRKAVNEDEGGWALNPIQVQRDCLLPVDENKSEGHLTQSEYSSIIYSSPGGHGSPCESPVRQDRFVETAYHTSPVISPGKLKTHIIQSRAAIFKQIMQTQQEIEANSPTKTSTIDQRLINSLKRRRADQRRAKSKPVAGEYRVELPMADPNWGQNPWVQTRKRMTEYQDDVIQKLKDSLATKNKNVNQDQSPLQI